MNQYGLMGSGQRILRRPVLERVGGMSLGGGNALRSSPAESTGHIVVCSSTILQQGSAISRNPRRQPVIEGRTARAFPLKAAPHLPFALRGSPNASPSPQEQRRLSGNHAAPRIGLTTASFCAVAQYTAHSAIKAARLANCEPR